MKQSVKMSMIETSLSTIVGYLMSLAIQLGVVWWYDLPLQLHQNLTIIGVFTLASLLRGFGLRRFFEALHIRRPLSPFMQAVILAEIVELDVRQHRKQVGERMEFERRMTRREVAHRCASLTG